MDEKWTSFLTEQKEKQYVKDLFAFIKERRKVTEVYPPTKDMMSAFNNTPYHELKVVVVGNEPYNRPFYADGMAYSTGSEETPPMLRNIIREVRSSAFPEFSTSHVELFQTNSLKTWADQGVLLLNTLLTSEKDKAMAHKGKGWETFTEETIKFLNGYHYKLVFMLWGSVPQKYVHLIDSQKHLVLTAAHPNATEFRGNNHFKKANEFILENYFNKRQTISWHTITS